MNRPPLDLHLQPDVLSPTARGGVGVGICEWKPDVGGGCKGLYEMMWW